MGNMLLRSILKNKVSYYPNISFISTNPNSDNPRNWLTEAIGINLKQKLFYEKSVNGSTPLYNGTITAQQFGVNAEKEEKYYYDKLNRITNYTNTNNNTETIEYADKLGNIKKITRTGESTATIAFAYNGNRISQANNKNYLYNVNGSVLNNGEINISNYNELNLPNRISKANTTMYFTYTADGKKIFKNIDNKEVRFYDDGIEFIKARLDSPNVKLEIINTDNGKIQVKGTKYYYQYFLKDHLGNVRAIVSDSNRAVIQRSDYYAFGKVRLQGDTAIKYLYNGNEYQAGLDVYDFNARTYDPVTGRFLQVDPNVEDGEQQGFNPYHFSFDNPIRYNDPDGRCPTCLAAIIGAVAGSLIGGGIEVASQLYNNGSVNNWRAVGGSTLQGALTGAVTGLTGGGSLLTTATVSGITNAIGGAVNRKIQGQGTTLTDFSVDAGIGAVLGAGTKIAGSVLGGIGKEKTVYRVFGGDARAEGYSWTPKNPTNVKNFRDVAGLPSGKESGSNNTATFMIKGKVNSKNILIKHPANKLDGNKGGLTEYKIDPLNVKFLDFKVLKP